MRNNPCNGCEEEDGREVGCHSWCPRHIKWKKKRKKANKERHKDDDYGGYITDLISKNR